MLITLLTDLGHTGTSVGQMKGVVWGINPQAPFVDLTHEIPPQDVRLAAAQLARWTRFLPARSMSQSSLLASGATVS